MRAPKSATRERPVTTSSRKTPALTIVGAGRRSDDDRRDAAEQDQHRHPVAEVRDAAGRPVVIGIRGVQDREDRRTRSPAARS